MYHVSSVVSDMYCKFLMECIKKKKKKKKNQFMKVGGIKTWKELTICVQQLVRLLFNNNFINPGLVL